MLMDLICTETPGRLYFEAFIIGTQGEYHLCKQQQISEFKDVVFLIVLIKLFLQKKNIKNYNTLCTKVVREQISIF